MASCQRESTESEKGKGHLIGPSSPSLRINLCSPNGSSSKLLVSAIRAHRDALVESIARDYATVGVIGKEGADFRESNDGEDVASGDTRVGVGSRRWCQGSIRQIRKGDPTMHPVSLLSRREDRAAP
ncbi:hypothetical protein Bca4012_020338 [Brassica carinata]